MRSLFLTSMFAPLAAEFRTFAGGDCRGKTACLIPTASSQQTIKHFVNVDRRALTALGINVSDLEVSKASLKEIRERIARSDYIMVTGGNTFYLLQELRKSGADQAIIEHINAGKTYIGVSAGSVILSPSIDFISHMDSTDAVPSLNGDYTGLGVLDFYLLPHVGNFPFKAAAKAIQRDYSHRYDLHAISNREAIVIRDDSESIVRV
ncbi:MAG: Type 1 glutamine amidotransferase-like domain-containing protein [Bifidobacterium aquikefiri]|uniref:Peptidase S51 n=1 Tax=Bifidobacterium aquikefiri TaxID=1653207 RepID=A0A261G193_9BIFI|nr:Type 1 glutamine amidotransferase-like domain-containing protein [Bifidobacterium aquikefiri]OZG64943.1 peptidase S51 [Bifidobacterium aquikefiri]